MPGPRGALPDRVRRLPCGSTVPSGDRALFDVRNPMEDGDDLPTAHRDLRVSGGKEPSLGLDRTDLQVAAASLLEASCHMMGSEIPIGDHLHSRTRSRALVSERRQGIARSGVLRSSAETSKGTEAHGRTGDLVTGNGGEENQMRRRSNASKAKAPRGLSREVAERCAPRHVGLATDRRRRGRRPCAAHGGLRTTVSALLERRARCRHHRSDAALRRKSAVPAGDRVPAPCERARPPGKRRESAAASGRTARSRRSGRGRRPQRPRKSGPRVRRPDSARPGGTGRLALRRWRRLHVPACDRSEARHAGVARVPREGDRSGPHPVAVSANGEELAPHRARTLFGAPARSRSAQLPCVGRAGSLRRCGGLDEPELIGEQDSASVGVRTRLRPGREGGAGPQPTPPRIRRRSCV